MRDGHSGGVQGPLILGSGFQGQSHAEPARCTLPVPMVLLLVKCFCLSWTEDPRQDLEVGKAGLWAQHGFKLLT